MIEDAFVVGAVAHGYNGAPENQRSPMAQQIVDMLHAGHVGFTPRGREEYALDAHRFAHGADPDLVAHALFAESRTDACIYHGVPIFGTSTSSGAPTAATTTWSTS